MGCGIGLRKMGRISGAIKEDALEHAADWHFSHENIVAANDRIVAVMDGLDLPEIYRRQEGRPTRPAPAKNSRSRRTRSLPTYTKNISAKHGNEPCRERGCKYV